MNIALFFIGIFFICTLVLFPIGIIMLVAALYMGNKEVNEERSKVSYIDKKELEKLR
jgi:hypothetical protein|tara:strand:+ start:577 stop:747 length:171 start_codon:yes stop_codon:yes gene_type:complete